MTGTQHPVPACPALSRCGGTTGFVPPCPGCPTTKQASDNAEKYAVTPLVPADRDTRCTAYGGPDRRRERGSPRRGDPFPLGTRPDPAGLSRYRIDHPGSRRDLASVQGLRKRQHLGAKCALTSRGCAGAVRTRPHQLGKVSAMKARLLRRTAPPSKATKVVVRLIEIERELAAICTQDSNPLTLKGAGELARLHQRLRDVRHVIEREFGL